MKHVQNSSILYSKMVLPYVQVGIVCIVVIGVYTIIPWPTILSCYTHAVFLTLMFCFFS